MGTPKASTHRIASLKVWETHSSSVARSSIEWVAGDPRWSSVYAAIQWVALLFAGVLAVVLVFNLLWLAGTFPSMPAPFLFLDAPSGLVFEWVWIGPCLALVAATLILQTRKAVWKVAPTNRGLAVRFSPIWSRVIPWTDIRWTSATRVEWTQLLGTGRATVTPEQSQRIYRWFYPS